MAFGAFEYKTYLLVIFWSIGIHYNFTANALVGWHHIDPLSGQEIRSIYFIQSHIRAPRVKIYSMF